MLLLIFFVPFSLFGWVSSQYCRYERLSLNHTFCKKPNPTCNIVRSGVSKTDIEHILKLHDQYRSYVALGKETRATRGTLPKASDMMQMVWDDELAAIAQKWAENCVYAHDCNECRSVDDYFVGQNIAFQDWLCTDERCANSITQYQLEPDWDKVMSDFYMEVKDFDNKLVQNYQSKPFPVVGHFTQMIWAKSWRVGCGFTVFKTGYNYRRLYGCNYGPGGNTQTEPIYKAGEPCSACPINSCCGNSCPTKMGYPGLCEMKDPNTAPIYRRNLNNLLFYCDGQKNTKDCGSRMSGVEKWQFKSNLNGDYLSVVLQGGESTTLRFNNWIQPSRDNFCLLIVLRKGPLKAGLRDRSRLQVDFNLARPWNPVRMDLTATSKYDMPYSLNLSWKAKTTFSITFSVEKKAGPHMLEINDIIAYNGQCSSRKF